MNNSNYPDGVTDAHPHFNPNERPVTVACGADEALIVPSFAVKAGLNDLEEYVNRLTKGRMMDERPHTVQILESIVNRIGQLREQVEANEQEGEYECEWEGEQELPVSEEAEWTCPRCGVDRSTDTAPEERDPDEGWDSRYDD